MYRLQPRTSTTAQFGSSQFFRNRLLTLESDAIAKYLERLDQEARDIRQESLKLAWYMRGGITYEQVMQLGNQERQLIGKLAKENIETTKKTNLPWF